MSNNNKQKLDTADEDAASSNNSVVNGQAVLQQVRGTKASADDKQSNTIMQ